MKKRKIAIVTVMGSYVGALIYYALMVKTLAQEIILIDSNSQKCKWRCDFSGIKSCRYYDL